MQISTMIGELHQQSADAAMVFVYQDQVAAAALPLWDEAHAYAAVNSFSGKANQVLLVPNRDGSPAHTLILVGLGAAEADSNLAMERFRQAAAQGILKARELKAGRVISILPEGIDTRNAAQAMTEGSLLGLYRFEGYKSRPSASPPDPTSLSIICSSDVQKAALDEGIRVGRALANGANLARMLVDMPSNFCTPSFMAETAQQIEGLDVSILDEAAIEALKMGAFLAVAKGSATPPRFIIMDYSPAKGENYPTLVLVGKGVTFDTGGYSIKGAESMARMKLDMGGGGAVIGAMRAIAELQPALRVVGLVPSAENMISDRAYRPQDVISASNGMTIEIDNTDAEGRLLLADALVYAQRYQPTAVVDIATLTAAKASAVGRDYGGLFCMDDSLCNELIAAGERSQDRLWRLPLSPSFLDDLKSQVADTKNSGGRWGGASSAAAFLQLFVDYPWAHIDMAGNADSEGKIPYHPKGATGYGARLLAEWVNERGWYWERYGQSAQ